MTIREANHLYTVSYLAFQGNLLQTINQSSLWRPKVDIFGFFGIPFIRYINIENSKQVLRAIRLTPQDTPIDLIIHTPGV
jgi:hypothetical protein